MELIIVSCFIFISAIVGVTIPSAKDYEEDTILASMGALCGGIVGAVLGVVLVVYL